MAEKIVKDSHGLVKDLVNDCISRKAAIELIERMKSYHQDADDIAEMIANMPSAQPERKRGHWAGIDDEPCETWECDQCGYIQEFFDGDQPNYCPNCGADMREVDDGRPE